MRGFCPWPTAARTPTPPSSSSRSHQHPSATVGRTLSLFGPPPPPPPACDAKPAPASALFSIHVYTCMSVATALVVACVPLRSLQTIPSHSLDPALPSWLQPTSHGWSQGSTWSLARWWMASRSSLASVSGPWLGRGERPPPSHVHACIRLHAAARLGRRIIGCSPYQPQWAAGLLNGCAMRQLCPCVQCSCVHTACTALQMLRPHRQTAHQRWT